MLCFKNKIEKQQQQKKQKSANGVNGNMIENTEAHGIIIKELNSSHEPMCKGDSRALQKQNPFIPGR